MIRRLFGFVSRVTREDHGFTLVPVLTASLVLGMFSAAAWAAANGDIPLARNDQDRKSALEAADAGVQWYTHQLEQSTNFWATCAPSTQGVQLQGTRSSWRSIGVNNESFAVEVMRAPGKTCNADKLDSTLLNNGTLQIRVTGRYSSGKKVVQRQQMASFRRDGFLDFVWYTKRETAPPASYNGTKLDPTVIATNCDKVRALRVNGNDTSDATHPQCSIIDFWTGDNIHGPMHTEDDSFSVQGTPIFGRDADDKIEVSGAGATTTTMYSAHGSASVDTEGTKVAPGKTIDPPKDNGALRNFADVIPAGNTCIQLVDGGMYVSDKLTSWGGTINCPDKTGTYRALTDDTVVYVDNNTTCTNGYQKFQQYPKDTCGNVAVWGTYSTNITIGSANDVIVYKSLTRKAGSDALLGLVANQFVRVYHPIKYNGASTCDYSTDNYYATPPVTEIDAAILATQGSFLNDNWFCGDPENKLTIKGTIAQYWRGAVGYTTGSNRSGYDKDYWYDDRLKYRQPPQFLDAATSQWHILRQTEQSPVASG
ncbi:MAG TPA: hypothetical protein VI318_26065 [Baekduia sp.]